MPTGSAAPPAGDLLRAARLDRGWSQSDAARRLAALAGGGARPGSLKTQLSRWENGHAGPAPEHRALLAELYGRSTAELGLEPEPAGPGGRAERPRGADGLRGADRLRSALARAAALDGSAVDLLEAQVRATAALDHRLGTAAAHGALAAQVQQLHELLVHHTGPGTDTGTEARLAGLLAVAALLAGDQERDRDEPDLAWRSYTLAGDAARRSGRPELLSLADGRRARLSEELTGADDPARIDVQAPPVPVTLGQAHDGPSARERTEEQWRATLQAHRDGRTADAAAAAARARGLALRNGSARTLALLAGLGR